MRTCWGLLLSLYTAGCPACSDIPPHANKADPMMSMDPQLLKALGGSHTASCCKCRLCITSQLPSQKGVPPASAAAQSSALPCRAAGAARAASPAPPHEPAPAPAAAAAAQPQPASQDGSQPQAPPPPTWQGPQTSAAVAIPAGPQVQPPPGSVGSPPGREAPPSGPPSSRPHLPCPERARAQTQDLPGAILRVAGRSVDS